MLKLLLATGNVFFSLILGAIALALVGIHYPETLSTLLAWAREVKLFITSRGLDPHYNIWVELLLEERQLLFMGFTVAARILLSILTGLIGFGISRATQA